MKDQSMKTGIGAFFFVVALVFVYRSFYCMRIPTETGGAAPSVPAGAKAAAR
jgi:hypothetical protein